MVSLGSKELKRLGRSGDKTTYLHVLILVRC